MQTKAFRLAILGAALLSPALATGSELDVVATTSRAVYHARRAGDVDVRRSEAFLERLDSLFGAAPNGARIEYFRHDGVAEMQALVGFAAVGVTDLATGRIDSVKAYHPHELVHAAAGRLGRPSALFSEGLAVALTSEGEWKGRRLDEVAREFTSRGGQLRELLVGFALADADRDYALAGSFVSFLLDRYGIDTMKAFLRGCDGSPRAIERSLVAAYGRSFAALESEWSSAVASPAPAARAWHDAATWPASLQVAVASRPAPAAVAAAAASGAGPLRMALTAALEPAPAR